MPKGRTKGSLNKYNATVNETADRLKINIFEILCMFAMGDWKGLGYDNECYFMEKSDGAHKMGYTIPPELRLKAAESASKYMYSQKQAVTISGDADNALVVKVENY